MTTASLRLRNPAQMRELMRTAGHDGKTLAASAGVTKQFVSLLLLDRRSCNPTVAAALAELFGVPVETLFFNPVLSDSSNNIKEDSVAPDLVVHNEDPCLYIDEVSLLVKIPVKTLRHLRVSGEGPPFFKRGQRLMIRQSAALKWFTETYERTDPDA